MQNNSTNIPIKITFLGTGTSTGVPVVACDCPVCTSPDSHDKRYRTSALITIGDTNLVIDSGPDFRTQMLINKVQDIHAILYTHGHRDHIAGLDDIRGFNYILNKKIHLYGAPRTMEAIKTEFPYIFSNSRYFGAPQVTIHHIDNEPFFVNGIHIIPIRVLHNKLPIFGFRIGNLTYITDANYISPEELNKIKGSTVIVLNALRNSKHISHFSLPEALDIITTLNPQRAYLTHISHFMGCHNTIETSLPAHVHLAYDGLTDIIK